MCSLVAILIALNSIHNAGPMDAFRANYASIKVSVRYRHTMGAVDSGVLDRIWRLGPSDYDGADDYGEWGAHGYALGEIEGRWACDGAVEYYDFATSEAFVARLRERKIERLASATEALYGESICVGHDYRSQAPARYVGLWNYKDPVFIGIGTGAFGWWGDPPFPRVLERNLRPGALPERRMTVCDGRPVEVEIYDNDETASTGVWQRVEIFYDPATGYLPRYMRHVTTHKDFDWASVGEMYLRDAKRCSAGGFVPTEWYVTVFSVANFRERYPSYDCNTRIEPTERIQLRHFQVTEFKDLAAPIALEKLDGVKGIVVNGHHVNFPPGTRTLTVSGFKRLAGKHLTNPVSVEHLAKIGAAKGSAVPSVDRDEMSEFADQSDARRPSYLGVIGGVAIVAGLAGMTLALRRRFAERTLLLIWLWCMTSGCAKQPETPVVRLQTKFNPDRVIYGAREAFPTLKLLIRNGGDQSVQLRGADGGCSCRRLDASRFPFLLKPGESLAIDANFSAGPAPDLHQFAITFDTDRGRIPSVASLVALPAHQLSPDGFYVTLQEGGQSEWEFELIHRAVFRAGEPRQECSLEVPAGFSAVKGDVHAEPVNRAREFRFEDTTYRISRPGSNPPFFG